MHINYLTPLSKNVCNVSSINEWLTCTSSLTDKLRHATGMADVKVLSQDWIKPTSWDNAVLDLDEELLQREIFMQSHGLDYWYARTLIPSECYQADPVFFKQLETGSLQRLVFNEPKVVLQQRHYYTIDKTCTEFEWIKQYKEDLQGQLWVRLGCFSFKNQHNFYLIEVLFPELERLV